MSARDKPPEYESNKEWVQCNLCGAWMTRQGLNGHLRFFHERDWEPERAMVVLLGSGDSYAFYLIMQSILRPRPLLEEERKALLGRYQLYVLKGSRGRGGTARPGGQQQTHSLIHQGPPGGYNRATAGEWNPRSLRGSDHQEGTGSRRSKTLAECPVCHSEMTRTGLEGHIRFRHPQYWILNKALTHLVEAGDPYARSIVSNNIPFDVNLQIVLLRRYRKAIGK